MNVKTIVVGRTQNSFIKSNLGMKHRDVKIQTVDCVTGISSIISKNVNLFLNQKLRLADREVSTAGVQDRTIPSTSFLRPVEICGFMRR